MLNLLINTLDGKSSNFYNLTEDGKNEFLVAYHTGKIIKFAIENGDRYFVPANIVDFTFTNVEE